MSESETRSEKNEAGTVIFDDSLDITLVAGYFEQFSQLLNEQKSIILNGADIERVDGAGLQLLAAFFKSAEFLQISVQWGSIQYSKARCGNLRFNWRTGTGLTIFK